MPPRLLFDENLSDRLPRLVEGLYPGALHLHDLGLQGATDDAVWARARADDFLLVTKDEDFQRLSVARGAPPKVVWICLGNCATNEVATLLEKNLEVINAFVAHPEATVLALG